MKILSIDSGLERTGYSVFCIENKTPRYITSGLIKTSKQKNTGNRLHEIYTSIQSIIKKHSIKTVILERLFFFKNQKTVIKVSQTQGVILLLATQNNITVDFLTPLQIKQIITGYGRADKKSVQKMLALTMTFPKKITQDDEADAVACGLAYCYLKKNLLQ
jgi:crossover junction endodeoxyribonuclease RuvC